MPLLPQPVDLKKDLRYNRSRSLTAGVAMEIDALSEDERTQVIRTRLTNEQRKQYETHRHTKTNLDEKFSNIQNLSKPFSLGFSLSPSDLDFDLDIPKSKPFRKKQHKHYVRYNPETQILSINGEPILYSSAEKRAVICELVFSGKKDFRSIYSFKDMLSHHKDFLYGRKIFKKEQIRTAKDGINKDVRKIVGEDLFLGVGGIQRNPRFHF